MSNQAIIKASTIIDVAASPALMLGQTANAGIGINKTYTPAGPEKAGSGVFVWEDRSGGIENLFPRYSLSVKRPTGNAQNIKVVEKLVYPVPNVTSPSTGSGIQPLPSVAGYLIHTGEFSMPAWCGLVDRTAFLSLVMSFRCGTILSFDTTPSDATGAPLFDAVLNYEPIY